MRPMRFEDYVVARDDNGQQLDEQGIFDRITQGVKGMFGGGQPRELAAAGSRAKTSARTRKENQRRELAARGEAIGELKKQKTASFATLEQAEKAVTDAIMELLSLPNTIKKKYEEIERNYENNMSEIVGMLRKTPMSPSDRLSVKDALELVQQRVNAAKQIMNQANQAFDALPQARETVNEFIRDVRKHLVAYYNQAIRANMPQVEKVPEEEFEYKQFMPKTGPGEIGGLKGLGRKTGS